MPLTQKPLGSTYNRLCRMISGIVFLGMPCAKKVQTGAFSGLSLGQNSISGSRTANRVVRGQVCPPTDLSQVSYAWLRMSLPYSILTGDVPQLSPQHSDPNS